MRRHSLQEWPLFSAKYPTSTAPNGSTHDVAPIDGSLRKAKKRTSGARPTLKSDSKSAGPVDRTEQETTAPPGDEESALLINKERRHRDKRHLQFVATQPCLICGRSPSDAHHLRFAQPRAMGRKVSDEFTVPLCRVHHRQIHSVGDERAWWRVDRDRSARRGSEVVEGGRRGYNDMTTAPQEEVLLEDGLYWLLYALRNAPFLKEGGDTRGIWRGTQLRNPAGWLSNLGPT